MPRFDGTGPAGGGPMTGGGRGYCAVRLPDQPGQVPVGYAGLGGRLATAWSSFSGRLGLGLGRGRRGGRGGGRGRGRW